MMKKPSLLVVLLFLVFQFSARAQKRFIDNVYADANVGLFIAGYESNIQLQAGLGYLITRRHGLGASFRVESAGSSSSGESISGIGINYRYATPSGLIAKVGIGKILTGDGAENNSREFVFVSGKAFTNVAVAYQLREGLTFGLYYTRSPEIVFDTYLPAWELPPFPDGDELVYEGTFSRAFHGYGVTVGYTLPGRKKRTKGKNEEG